MVLPARSSRLMVIGRDHAELKELDAEDRRDQFASHFAARQRPLRPGRPTQARWVAELAFQIETHGLDDVGNDQRAGVEAEVDRRRARASFAS